MVFLFSMVVVMKDVLTVVQGNDLIEASYSLSIDEVRLIALASTKIDSRKGSVGDIDIYPSEFASAFESQANVYRDLTNSVQTLATKTVKIPIGSDKEAVFPWLSKGVYDRQPKDGSKVIIQFNQNIEPFLFELSERFTSIDFNLAAKLNTPFSFRLYQWLIKERMMKSAKKGETIVVTLSLEWMKRKAGLDGKYANWDGFAAFVIKPAVEKINANTDISVSWKPVKTGRRVTHVEFAYITEKAKDPKPIRPRLYRRPKVLKGSHEEGVWMRKNAELLLDYVGNSLKYDPNFKLTIPDLKKLISYVSIYDSSLEYQLKLELKERQRK